MPTTVSDEEWEAAPEGSRLMTDLTTGNQWIEPPAEPVAASEFIIEIGTCDATGHRHRPMHRREAYCENWRADRLGR